MDLFVKDLATLRKHIKVETGFQFATIEQDLQAAQEEELMSRFGRTFVTGILARYTEANPVPALTADEQTLIFHFQRIISHAAAVACVPYMIVSITDGGMSQKQTAQRNVVTKWAKVAYEDAHLDDSYKAIELSLLLLWEVRDDVRFSAWKDSPEEAESRVRLINSALDFDKKYKIGKSRRTFEAMFSLVDDADVKIKQIIGDEFHEELHTQIAEFSLTDANERVLPYIHSAITRYVAANSINRLPLKLDAGGIMITNAPVSFADSPKNYTQADAEKLLEMKSAATDSYLEKIEELKNFLNKNIEDYPLYAESDQYKNKGVAEDTNTPCHKAITL